MLRLARRGLRARGSDVSESVIDEARRRAARAQLDVSFRAAPIEVLDPSEDAARGFILCCEVMEHLDDPEARFGSSPGWRGRGQSSGGRAKSLWRLLNLGRLKYVRELGNTPGHLQHWSKRSFLRFLERRLEIVAVRSPVPWTMAVCRSA